MNKIILSIIGLTLIISVKAQVDPCVGQANGFLADPASCNKYWSCSGGVGKLQTCPTAFPIFSQVKQGCIEDDDSCVEYCPAGTSADPKALTGSCSKYLMCINGFVLQRDCGAGTAFDYVYKSCDLESKADCLTCPSDGNLYYLPDRKDCAGFYLCYNNQIAPIKLVFLNYG